MEIHEALALARAVDVHAWLIASGLSICRFSTAPAVTTICKGGAGDDTLYGMEGDDKFRDIQGSNVFYGGAGADLFQNVGAGNGRDIYCGGADIDTYLLDSNSSMHPDDVIMDFQAGPGGDQISLNNFLFGYLNPFTNNQMSAVQSGADTLIQYSGKTLVRLANVQSSVLTVDNFTAMSSGAQFGFSPDDVGLTVSGDNSNQIIQGTDSKDDLSGQDGADSLIGYMGDDKLYGGDGDDGLSGGYGQDSLYGGKGSDSLYGDYGDDILYGDDGQDIFSDTAGNNREWGEDGNDIFNDVAGFSGADTFYGGAGSDTYILSYYAASSSNVVADTVMDFQVGAGGDILSFSFLPAGLRGSSGDNPFQNGTARLVQVGNDAYLQLDNDPAGATYSYQTYVRLAGVDTNSFTADNFQGYTPNKVQSLPSTNGNDSITGSAKGETINLGRR